MGQSQSTAVDGQSIYKAATANDLTQLQRLINLLRANHQLSPQVLSWADKEGRAPLLVAASKNYYQIARKLLESGAEVRYLNTCVDPRGGTALHEATRSKHEAMAELLLEYGATPFQCNMVGKTCMDEAVVSGSCNLLRRFEQSAPWTGYLGVKSTTLAGMSQTFKTRYMAVVPLLPAPVAPSSSPAATHNQPVIRRQLWVYKDTSSTLPKCRVWLDGATVVRTSTTDAVLRLHASHKPPQGDVFARYDRGYCIFLRVKDNSPQAFEALESFMAVVNAAIITPQGAGLRPTQLAYPGVPSLTGPVASSMQADSLSMVLSGSTGSSLSGAGPHAHSTPQLLGPTTSVTPPPPHAMDNMGALPGESDAQFAQRLARSASSSSRPDNSLPARQTPSSTSSLPGTRPSSASTPEVSFQSIWAPSAQAAVASSPTPTASLPAPAAAPKVETIPSAPPLGSLGAPDAQADDTLCVICLTNPREAGYLHGSTLHRCVCRECCGQIRPGEPCPLCRLPVERVVGVF